MRIKALSDRIERKFQSLKMPPNAKKLIGVLTAISGSTPGDWKKLADTFNATNFTLLKTKDIALITVLLLNKLYSGKLADNMPRSIDRKRLFDALSSGNGTVAYNILNRKDLADLLSEIVGLDSKKINAFFGRLKRLKAACKDTTRLELMNKSLGGVSTTPPPAQNEPDRADTPIPEKIERISAAPDFSTKGKNDINSLIAQIVEGLKLANLDTEAMAVIIARIAALLREKNIGGGKVDLSRMRNYLLAGNLKEALGSLPILFGPDITPIIERAFGTETYKKLPTSGHISDPVKMSIQSILNSHPPETPDTPKPLHHAMEQKISKSKPDQSKPASEPKREANEQPVLTKDEAIQRITNLLNKADFLKKPEPEKDLNAISTLTTEIIKCLLHSELKSDVAEPFIYDDAQARQFKHLLSTGDILQAQLRLGDKFYNDLLQLLLTFETTAGPTLHNALKDIFEKKSDDPLKAQIASPSQQNKQY